MIPKSDQLATKQEPIYKDLSIGELTDEQKRVFEDFEIVARKLAALLRYGTITVEVAQGYPTDWYVTPHAHRQIPKQQS